MNGIFFSIIAAAFVIAAGRTLVGDGTVTGGTMHALAQASLDGAGDAVKLAIGLIGVLALFLGLMRVGERAGVLTALARLVRPLMIRLFPDVPADHPAMGAMILNIAANVLGLGNAATPFGIRAMQRLQDLPAGRAPGDRQTATDAMVLFLAINTSGVTLLPTTVIALRAAAGSTDPAGILPTTLFATLCATVAAIAVAKGCAKWWPVAPAAVAAPSEGEVSSGGEGADSASTLAALDNGPGAGPEMTAAAGYPAIVGIVAAILVISLIPLTIAFGAQIADWIVPSLVFGFLAYGMARKVPVYAAFVDGAREGFDVAVRIIPYLIAILVAVAMLKASGAVDMLLVPLGRLTAPLGLPAEGLVMALLRAVSGSGAFAYLASVINDPAIGPDSYTGYLVSTIQASTETTFYVVAVYFGAVGIKRFRHAIVTGLAADAVALVAAVAICSLLHAR